MLFPEKQVQVSVLLAVRNEETNIERCLKSISELDYPQSELEVCIGDDDSTDNTAELVLKFIKDKPQFKYFRISKNVTGLKGKANVLAQLANKAEGQYFFFCDADITVQPTWITSMLSHFRPDTGVVIGITRMSKKPGLLASFLSLEWLFILSIMRFFSLFRIGMTGLGNNMAVSRAAYEAVGGYEKIGFSIVEDYALFISIIRKKFGFVQAYTSQILAYSEPVSGYRELIIQRRRWIQGIMKSPFVLQLCVIFCALFVPAMAVLYFWDPHRSLNMLVSHYLFITSITLAGVILLRQFDLIKTVFFFWFYLMTICFVMLVIYIFPGKTVWKGREY